MLLPIVALVLLLICFLDYLWKYKINSKLSKLQGPLNLPIFGGTWFCIDSKRNDLLEMATKVRNQYGRTVMAWIFHMPAILTSDLSFVQEILSHPTQIKKNRMYNLLSEWLGEGLLMSYGSKWLGRRRAITPAFHFNILEQFVKVFDRQAQVLVDKYAKFADGTQVIDVYNSLALATLDVICETAMGVRINAQTNEHSEYVQQILEMGQLTTLRFGNPYRLEFLFKLLAPQLAKRQKEARNKLHSFTEHIIEERRRKMLKRGAKALNVAESEIGIKVRMALLDVLLMSTIEGKPLSNADIREEVDTFMFEGHDTTKSAMGFTLYSISREPEVQAKLYAEIKEVIGTDTNQKISYRQLMDLKYTEKVIRESLRMYPSVPFIGRHLTQDCYINGECIPKGVSVTLALITMQNDAEYFPEPHRFLPERPGHENAFASVPFSAGPRNCIGQRFAMLEVKAFVARIVQSYELLPLGDPIELVVSIILKSKTGWQIGLRKRN